MICDVLVVDDSSSEEDRRTMMRTFPEFTYIFKPGRDKGHASSLNLILNVIKTRYLLYIEDDWKTIANTVDMITDAMIVLRAPVENPIAQ
eukprot:11505377-Ditylum_brightwellii.AAC.1